MHPNDQLSNPLGRRLQALLNSSFGTLPKRARPSASKRILGQVLGSWALLHPMEAPARLNRLQSWTASGLKACAFDHPEYGVMPILAIARAFANACARDWPALVVLAQEAQDQKQAWKAARPLQPFVLWASSQNDPIEILVSEDRAATAARAIARKMAHDMGVGTRLVYTLARSQTPIARIEGVAGAPLPPWSWIEAS